MNDTFFFTLIFLHFISLCFNLQVDVIVNTISTNCDLSKGEISKAILKKAGKKIQEEIYKRKNSTSFLGGHLYITNVYELKCKAVYHTALADTAKEVDLFIFYQ